MRTLLISERPRIARTTVNAAVPALSLLGHSSARWLPQPCRSGSDLHQFRSPSRTLARTRGEPIQGQDRLVRFARRGGAEPPLARLGHFGGKALLAPVKIGRDALVSAIFTGNQVFDGIARLPNHVFGHLYRDRTTGDQRHHVA